MISRDTHIYISTVAGGQRYWLVKAETGRDQNSGKIVVMPKWTTTPSEARPAGYETAIIFRRRSREEYGASCDFSLSAGSLDFIEPENNSNPNGEDTRADKSFRGIRCRPGVDVKSGQRCYFVHILSEDGRFQINSVKGDTPEQAVQKVIDLGYQNFAERSQVEQAPIVQQQQQRPAGGPRVRPGDLVGSREPKRRS
jgi:hypothetical protein